MDSIFFEKQEASLCAQHALNMLLQGPYFSAVDLAEIARDLDERENLVFAADEPSSRNMDDSGFFSVQKKNIFLVISQALRVFNLELVPLTSPRAVEYKAEPTCGRAYICNLSEHWFTIRRFGLQWFKLNSLLSAPQLISDTYLSLYFAQLANDGYSIFVVEGELPQCRADEVLMQCPIDPSLATQAVSSAGEQKEDEDLARAIALSLSGEKKNEIVDARNLQTALEESKRLDETNDLSFQQALQESEQEARKREDEEMERQLQCALHMSLAANRSMPKPLTVESDNLSQTELVRASGEEEESATAAEVRLKR